MADYPIITPNEEWRDIPGMEGFYQASSLGRVRSLGRVVEYVKKGWVNSFGTLVKETTRRDHRPGRILGGGATRSGGYPVVRISLPSGQRTLAVHTLVCAAFHGPRPLNHDAAHNDGNPGNTCPTNLRWATRLENESDKKRHGTQITRDKGHGNTKLSPSDVERMMEMKRSGMMHKEIAAHFGISHKWVSDLASQIRKAQEVK